MKTRDGCGCVWYISDALLLGERPETNSSGGRTACSPAGARGDEEWPCGVSPITLLAVVLVYLIFQLTPLGWMGGQVLDTVSSCFSTDVSQLTEVRSSKTNTGSLRGPGSEARPDATDATSSRTRTRAREAQQGVAPFIRFLIFYCCCSHFLLRCARFSSYSARSRQWHR